MINISAHARLNLLACKSTQRKRIRKVPRRYNNINSCVFRWYEDESIIFKGRDFSDLNNIL